MSGAFADLVDANRNGDLYVTFPQNFNTVPIAFHEAKQERDLQPGDLVCFVNNCSCPG